VEDDNNMEPIDIIIDAICYLRRKFPQNERIDKLKIVKLIYLADKYHLLWYGRTITDDSYVIVEKGPMGSKLEDVLDPNTEYLLETEKEKISKIIDRNETFNITIRDTNHQIKSLSKTDYEAINFIFERFGKRTGPSLVEYVHQYPEYLDNEFYINKGIKNAVKIKINDVLGIFTGDLISADIPPEHIEETREILLGGMI
jgi:uncharacterized phage-associated protein